MRAFVSVVDHQSFSGAAEALGLTPSAVSKLVTKLEGRLGVRLLNRTTRRLALTSEGDTYFEDNSISQQRKIIAAPPQDSYGRISRHS
jgi:DNA-binding transcriptional LysR family regulator